MNHANHLSKTVVFERRGQFSAAAEQIRLIFRNAAYPTYRKAHEGVAL
jgi:hypothetical protein